MWLLRLLILPWLLVLFFVLSSSRTFNAIYQFGDSIADTGNLVQEGALGRFSAITRLPYGETYFRNPTGRCSDGRLLIDFLATHHQIPFLNPYLKQGADFRHGANFAVAGATALNATFLLSQGIILPFTSSSLQVQLHWFEAHLDNICSDKTATECKEELKQALFLVGEIGANDYNYAFMEGKSMQWQIMNYQNPVVQVIMEVTQRLIQRGAKTVVVPGNFPIGCFPGFLTAFNEPSKFDARGCHGELNEFARLHNRRLLLALDRLRKKHPHVVIKYADYYNAFLRVFDDAASLELDDGSRRRACCGAGGGDYNFNGAALCGSDGATVCSDPSKYISWDGIHLTERAYQYMFLSLLAST